MAIGTKVVEKVVNHKYYKLQKKFLKFLGIFGIYGSSNLKPDPFEIRKYGSGSRSRRLSDSDPQHWLNQLSSVFVRNASLFLLDILLISLGNYAIFLPRLFETELRMLLKLLVIIYH
jgi:hypothetical protein